MARKLVAKIGEYETAGGEKKGRYITIGVILSNDKGEYALIDPAVNLAGVLIKQRLLNPQKAGESVMCGIFEQDSSGGNQSGSAHPQHDKANEEFDENLPF